MSNPGAAKTVDRYAREVLDGTIPAGTYHKLACARHVRDRARENTAAFPYVFKAIHADRLFRFAGQLKHYKGKKWSGQRFTPTSCQLFRLGSLFGWRRADGRRRFTTAYNELPRKQGKTFEAAIIALYTTFFEGEPGAEGYIYATKREQACRVFDDCSIIVKSSGLHSRIAGLKRRLYREQNHSFLQPLGADADSTDGLNPHLIVADELHAYKDRRLIDVMESATMARGNPLHYQITTAGDDPVSPCGDQHEYACKILDGVLEDEAFFAFIAHADLEDDWLDEATWKKANPHYGISVEADEVRKLALKATHMPSAAAEFKQKILNLWVNTSQACLSMEGWRRGQTTWTWQEMRGQPCFVGIDLASKLDLMSLSFVFPPHGDRQSWRILNYIWTPEETLRDRALRDRAPYQQWVDEGWLLTTSGPTMTSSVVRQILATHKHDFDIEAIGLDEWHAEKLIGDLLTDGFHAEQVLVVPQRPSGMSAAEARFQAEVLAGHIDARSCPVTMWAASNVVNQPDGNGNVFFTKNPRKMRGRIDPIKSATIAMSLALRLSEPKEAAFQMFVYGGVR